MKSGFLLIDKPAGITSFGVCARVRKALNIKKVGHTGTLDPFATGLLVVAVGKATRLIPYPEKAEKEYEATFCLGATTPTLDPEGEIIADAEPISPPEKDTVQAVLASFLGEGEQVPPAFSALKVNGKRAYSLARRGEKVALKPRKIAVKKLELLDYTWPEMRVLVRANAGFYVRALARDVAQKLGTTGYCAALRRTKVGDADLADAEPLEAISGLIDPQFIVKTLPQREIILGRLRDFWDGRAFPYSGADGEKYLILSQGKTVGVGEMICGKLQPRIVL